MTKLRTWLTLAAASALLCLPTVAAADTTVKAGLIELNDSGAEGTVMLTMTDDGGLKVVDPLDWPRSRPAAPATHPRIGGRPPLHVPDGGGQRHRW